MKFIKEMIEVNRNLVEVYCLSGQSQQELESQLMDKNQNTLPIEVLLLEEDSASALVLLNLDEFHMYHFCKLIKISCTTFSMYTHIYKYGYYGSLSNMMTETGCIQGGENQESNQKLY